uniref:Uncharacterized protein n=1 Tax=Paramoeba aestuarina TaxID=180227 RepID=A0A7S4KF94_9EUKA
MTILRLEQAPMFFAGDVAGETGFGYVKKQARLWKVTQVSFAKEIILLQEQAFHVRGQVREVHSPRQVIGTERKCLHRCWKICQANSTEKSIVVQEKHCKCIWELPQLQRAR